MRVQRHYLNFGFLINSPPLKSACLKTCLFYTLCLSVILISPTLKGLSCSSARATPAPEELAPQNRDASRTDKAPRLYPRSYALVVGVDQSGSEWAPLDSAHKDAMMISDHLKMRGFEVTLLLGKDSTKSEILRNLQTVLPEKITDKDRFIFFFAGHGQTQLNAKQMKMGYIVPTDGQMTKGKDQWHTYISMRELRSIITESIPSKHTLLLFDSCFSGLMFTRGGLRRPNLGPRTHLKRKGVMALTAGADQQLAQDGLFTPILIQALSGEADENQDDVISFQEISMYTQREVKSRRAAQTPQFGILSGSGQMIFNAEMPTITTINLNRGSSTSNSVDATLSSTAPPPPSSTWSYIASVTGGLLTVAGGLIAWHGFSRRADLIAIGDPKEFNQKRDSDWDNIENEYYSGLITGGVGLSVLVAYSIYTLLSAEPESTARSSKSTTLTTKDQLPTLTRARSIIPVVNHNGLGLRFSW
jgi:hypothetical protein